jgi:hypothetical protein
MSASSVRLCNRCGHDASTGNPIPEVRLIRDVRFKVMVKYEAAYNWYNSPVGYSRLQRDIAVHSCLHCVNLGWLVLANMAIILAKLRVLR